MEVGGNMSRWCCTVIYDEENRKYRCLLQIEGSYVDGLPEDVGYAELRKSIKCLTGKELPYHKDMIWERLSYFEKIATIDATQLRTDCRVRLNERQNGWKPKWDSF